MFTFRRDIRAPFSATKLYYIYIHACIYFERHSEAEFRTSNFSRSKKTNLRLNFFSHVCSFIAYFVLIVRTHFDKLNGSLAKQKRKKRIFFPMPCYYCLARVLFFLSFVCNYTNDSSPSILFSSRISSRRFIIQRFTIVLFPWLTLIADLLSIWVRHHNSNVPGIKFSFEILLRETEESN